MEQVNDSYVIARMDPERKAAVVAAAARLKVTITDLVQGAMRVLSGEIQGNGWEVRRIYLDGDRILSIGEEIPTLPGGVPIPAVSCKVVAPIVFWRTVEAALKSPDRSAS